MISKSVTGKFSSLVQDNGNIVFRMEIIFSIARQSESCKRRRPTERLNLSVSKYTSNLNQGSHNKKSCVIVGGVSGYAQTYGGKPLAEWCDPLNPSSSNLRSCSSASCILAFSSYPFLLVVRKLSVVRGTQHLITYSPRKYDFCRHQLVQIISN